MERDNSRDEAPGDPAQNGLTQEGPGTVRASQADDREAKSAARATYAAGQRAKSGPVPTASRSVPTRAFSVPPELGRYQGSAGRRWIRLLSGALGAALTQIAVSDLATPPGVG